MEIPVYLEVAAGYKRIELPYSANILLVGPNRTKTINVSYANGSSGSYACGIVGMVI